MALIERYFAQTILEATEVATKTTMLCFLDDTIYVHKMPLAIIHLLVILGGFLFFLPNVSKTSPAVG